MYSFSLLVTNIKYIYTAFYIFSRVVITSGLSAGPPVVTLNLEHSIIVIEITQEFIRVSIKDKTLQKISLKHLIKCLKIPFYDNLNNKYNIIVIMIRIMFSI